MGAACLAGFVAGVWWLQRQAGLPGPGLAFVAAALGGLAFAWRGGAPRHLAAAFAAAACFAIGAWWAGLQAQWRLADQLDERLEGLDVRVVGVVSGLPERTSRGWRFRFRIERAADGSGHLPRNVLLAWYDPPEAGVATAQPPVVPAQRWRLTVRLRRPHGTANPHGPDAALWALARGIGATGYVRPGPRECLGARVFEAGPLLERARHALREGMTRATGGLPYAGVLVALALGDQGSIPADQWQVFTRTGVNHLMSISGLHVTMMGALAALGAGWAWGRISCLRRHIARPDLAMGAGLAAALAYALLAGFEVPARRTVLMLAVAAGASWVRAGAGPGAVVGAALLVVVATDPLAVVAPGFWLSFGAVCAMVLAVERAVGPWAWLVQWGRLQWVLFVALAPALAALFGQVSMVAPLANAVAVPVVSFVVVPLSLMLALLPLEPLGALAHLPMALTATALERLSAWPGAVWTQQAPPGWAVAAALAGAAWLLAPRGFPARWTGVALFLPMLVIVPAAPAPGEARVTVLDVGQGLAVVVRTRAHTVVFDTGPAWGPEQDSGARVLVPYLRGEGVRRISALFLSHDDLDHTGGARSLLGAIPVSTVFTSLPPDHPALAVAKRVVPCQAGTHWTQDGVRLEILHPGPPAELPGRVRDNDRSCVLRVVTAHGRLLLTGDVERTAEAALLARGAPLRAEVLVVPHHGSATSSTPAFVAAVAPRVAVVAAGWRNRFGHPAAAVTARYHEAGAALLRTDLHGAVTISLGPGGPAVQRWRDVHRRYWHER